MKGNHVPKCPVCGMEIEDHEHDVIYLEMRFGFCSEQCLERFLVHPHLYAGFPGVPAPKGEGQVVLKSRTIRLHSPLSVEGVALIRAILSELMGVKTVLVSGNTIEITYDLLEVSLKELEVILENAGVRLSSGWVRRVLRFLIYELEDLEIEAHEAKPSHHYRP